MPIAPISPRVREILKDSIKGRELVKKIRKLNPDKNGHVMKKSKATKHGNCFWGHKWSKWKRFDGTGLILCQIQERRCLRCNKEQRKYIKYLG